MKGMSTTAYAAAPPEIAILIHCHTAGARRHRPPHRPSSLGERFNNGCEAVVGADPPNA